MNGRLKPGRCLLKATTCLAAVGALAVWVGAWLVPGVAGQEIQPEPRSGATVVLTNVQQILAIQTNWSAGVYEARLQAVVTFVNPYLPRIYVQVESHGIQVNLPGGTSPYRLGQRVEVTGSVMDGERTLRLQNAQVKIIGTGPMPEPIAATAEQLLTGQVDYRYSRISGLVRDLYAGARIVHFLVSDGFHPIEVTVYVDRMEWPPEWVDAELEFVGIPFPVQRSSGSPVRPYLFHCSSTNDLRVVRPGIPDRFDGRELLSIARAGQLPLNPKDRIRVSGVVIGSRPEVGYFVDDGSGVMFVDTTLPFLDAPAGSKELRREPQVPLQAGDQVEVIGSRYESFSLTPALIETEYRRIGRGKIVQPIAVTLAELKSGKHPGRLVTLKARLMEQRAWNGSDRRSHRSLVFRVDDDVFQAQWDGENLTRWDLTEAGYYSITGVNEVEASSTGSRPAFQIRLRSPDDVVASAEPPLWRRKEVHQMALVAGGVAALAGIWILAYQFQVRQLEQKIADRTEALRESEVKFRSLYESAGNAVLVHDDRTILDCNPAALRLFGYARREELIGQPPSEISAPVQANGEDSRVAAQKLWVAVHAQGSRRFEWLSRRKDGTCVPVEIFLTQLQLDGRTVVQAVIHDITERRRAEAERERSLAQERELNELKSRFVAIVSHEFRTPLGIITSSAEILDAYLDRLSPEERKSNLRDITDATRHMARMMEAVLLLGRAEAGKLAFRPAPFDLAIFCQRLVDEVTSATNRRCPIQLTAPPGRLEAQADESLLRHIFTNLLSNASKYSASGTLIEFQLAACGPSAVFTVRDHGIGIPEADTRQLFQAFHRGRNVGETPGTGLGMTIVKRCVELHNGQITFESQEGKGTAFVVTLPLFASVANS